MQKSSVRCKIYQTYFRPTNTKSLSFVPFVEFPVPVYEVGDQVEGQVLSSAGQNQVHLLTVQHYEPKVRCPSQNTEVCSLVTQLFDFLEKQNI